MNSKNNFEKFILQLYRKKNPTQAMMTKVNFQYYPAIIQEKINQHRDKVPSWFYRVGFVLATFLLLGILTFFLFLKDRNPQLNSSNIIIFSGDAKMYEDLELYSHMEVIEQIDSLLNNRGVAN